VAIDRPRVVKAGRKAVLRGERPRYRVRLASRTVDAMPWLEFDGRRPEEIAEAARRAIAAELRVRPHEVEVEPVKDDADVTTLTPGKRDGQLYGG
jgi:hypothetical protein